MLLSDDPFAPPSTRPIVDEGAATQTTRVDPAAVDAAFEQLQQRRAVAHRVAVARSNAATARQVAQSFSEYGRAFRKVAATRGSDVDHAVALFLAATCEEQADDYARLQARLTATADRAGSL